MCPVGLGSTPLMQQVNRFRSVERFLLGTPFGTPIWGHIWNFIAGPHLELAFLALFIDQLRSVCLLDPIRDPRQLLENTLDILTTDCI